MKNLLFCMLLCVLAFPATTDNFAALSLSGLSDKAGFAAGAGNISPTDTSKFLGLKFGVGAGAIINNTLISSIKNNSFSSLKIDEYFNLLPNVNSMAYLKIGLPKLPLFGIIDVGVRVGYFPKINLGQLVDPSVAITYDALHYGIEARTLLGEIMNGHLRLDLRISYDHDQGNLLFRTGGADSGITFSAENDIGWKGNSWGLNLMSGLHFKYFGIYAGLGGSLNSGNLNSAFSVTGTGIVKGYPVNTQIAQNDTRKYRPYSLRVMAGIKLLIIYLAGEFDITTKNYGIYILPVCLGF